MSGAHVAPLLARMHALEDFIRYAYIALFVVLAVRGLVEWRQGARGNRPALWFGITFILISCVAASGFVTDRLPEHVFADAPLPLRDLPSKIVVALLVLFPYSLHRFARWFAGDRRGLDTVVSLLTAVAIVATLLLPRFPDEGEARPGWFQLYLVVMLGQFTIVSLVVIARLWTAGRGKPSVARRRMRLLSCGATALVIALLTTSLASESISLGIAIGLEVLISALLFFAAFAPPGLLRAVWRRPEEERLRGSIAQLMSARSVDDIGDALLPPVAGLLGGSGAALVRDDGTVPARFALSDASADTLVEQCAQAPADLPVGQVHMAEGSALARLSGGWLAVRMSRFMPFFGQEELELLSFLAGLTAIALERAQGVARLREREAQLADAQEMAQLGSWETNLRDRTFTWSDEMYRIYGREPGDAITYDDLLAQMHPDDIEQAQASHDRAVREGTPAVYDYRIMLPDGGERTVHARASVMNDASGAPHRMVGTAQDVTEQKASEIALREAYEREREAIERLRALDEIKNGILAAVSHELRTPLTSILGFALTLQQRRSELDEEMLDEMLNHISAQASKLERLLSDLLDLDRLRRGLIHPSLRECNLGELVEQVVGGTHTADVELDTRPVRAAVDAPKIERIVENLVSNALKHTPAGTPVRVSVREEQDGALVCVDDAGPGVPDEYKQAIFAPFNRGGGALSHAPGTGIGLSLVAQFAALHGGRAWVEDRPGGGASFRVLLPYDGGAGEVRESDVAAAGG